MNDNQQGFSSTSKPCPAPQPKAHENQSPDTRSMFPSHAKDRRPFQIRVPAVALRHGAPQRPAPCDEATRRAARAACAVVALACLLALGMIVRLGSDTAARPLDGPNIAMKREESKAGTPKGDELSNEPSNIRRGAPEPKEGANKEALAEPTEGTPGSAPIGSSSTKEALAETVLRVAGPERRLVMASVASNYVAMARNWAASVARAGQGDRILLVANDNDSFAALSEQWPGQTVFMDANVSIEGNASESHYGTKFFHSVAWRKVAQIQQLLALDVFIFFNDVDIVWLRDPFPFFQGDFDVWGQEDVGLAGTTGPTLARSARGAATEWTGQLLCGCMQYFAPSVGARKLVDLWLATRGRTEHDQSGLNDAASQAKGEGVRIGLLPALQFPSGCLFFGPNADCVGSRDAYQKALSANKTSAVVAHANWVAKSSVKEALMKREKLWAPQDLAAPH